MAKREFWAYLTGWLSIRYADTADWAIMYARRVILHSLLMEKTLIWSDAGELKPQLLVLMAR